MVSNLPIVFSTVYILAVWLLFHFGPWDWPVEDSSALDWYIGVSIVVLIIGYRIGFRVSKPVRVKFIRYRTVTVLALLTVVLISIARTGSFFPSAFQGIQDPGTVYGAYVERSFSRGYWTYIEYVVALIGFSFYVLLAKLGLEWRAFNLKQRLAHLFVIFYYVSVYISIGVSKGLVAILFPLPLSIALLSLAMRPDRMLWRISEWIMYGIIIFALFLTYFYNVQVGREGGEAVKSVFGPPLNIYAKKIDGLPDSILIAYESLTRYLGQGFYALSLILNLEDGRPIYLSGASLFLFTKYLGTPEFFDSYIGILDSAYGWGYVLLWHSFFGWVVNGFGVFGSFLITLGLGVLLGFTWHQVIILRDCFDFAFFIMLVTIVLYIPANNQIFQSAESFVAFFIVGFPVLIKFFRSIFVSLAWCWK